MSEAQSIEWPKPPGPANGFNNYEDAVGQASRWAALENKRNREHMLVSVIPYYIERGADKPFDTSKVYSRHGYRNQPFPLSAPLYEPAVVSMSQVPGSGTAGFQPKIEPVKGADGANVPQFSHTELMGMCQVEFEIQTGLKDHFTTRMAADVLAAAGMTVTVPDIPLSDSFGVLIDDGIYSFRGNWQNSPPDGTRATNPNDGKEYIFYSKGTSVPMLKRLWLLPNIYHQWRG